MKTENNTQTLTCEQCKKQFIPRENTDYEVDGVTLCWYCITGEEE
jgi:hypothetical protein